jgi:multidrug efflux system membrane fusion protein
MSTTRARLIPPVIPLAIAIAFAGGCRHETAPTRALTPVRAAPALAAEEATGIRYSATIRPREEVALTFRVSGYVSELLSVKSETGRPRPVQAGDRVSRGAVLARLRRVDYEERVNQAKGSLAEVEAGRTKAQSDVERARRLFAKGSLTRPDLDAAEAQAAAAQARAAAAGAQVAASRVSLDDTSLVSPIDGVVLARSVEVGTLAAPGAGAFVIGDLGTVKAVFGVPDIVVRGLAAGLPLEVSTDAFPAERWKGTITAISPSADRTSRVFDVEVTIPNSGQKLKAGMIAVVEVQRPGARKAGSGAPTVPLTAVLKSPTDPQGFAVAVVAVVETSGTGDTAKVSLRDVKLGEVMGNSITILTGLAPNEKVIVTGASLVRDGETVRVIP